MKFTLAWLKEHLLTDAPLAAIAERLTMNGLEVERIEDRGRALAGFKVAAVISAKPHPNADKLQVLVVDTGEGEPIQVVCGAANARAGMKGVFAAPGSHIPGTGVDLKVGRIRGVESHGMLLSERELGLSDEHSGIVELAADAPLGKPFAELAGLNDPVLEINVTPNRPDCTGVHGIARDLFAAELGSLKEARIAAIPGRFAAPVGVSLEFACTASLCPGFALRLIRGVRNGPSPVWLQRRLSAIGLRPINMLVDITNLITFDRARPLHVFDAAKITGNLVVRRARDGETLLALDGRSYSLDPTMCVIADAAGVQSLAGIIGGQASGCSPGTRDVLIESALWVPANIADTGRKLGIASEARYRFERGVDPAFMVPGLELATATVLALGGGEPSEIVVVGEPLPPPKVIDFPLSELSRVAGLNPARAEWQGVLERLGFSVGGTGETLKIQVPSWRPDVGRKADIVEEVVRILGVNRVPSAAFDRGRAARRPVLTVRQVGIRKAKRALAAQALFETVNWSFVARRQASLFGGGQPELALVNPISAELSDMRPSLLPGLLAAAQRNVDRGIADIGLFEVGPVFFGDAAEQQFTAAAAVRRGNARPGGIGRSWTAAKPQSNVFDVKTDALAALAAAGAALSAVAVSPGGPAWFHPGRVGSLRIGPQNILGHFGELHPAVLEELAVEGPVFAFEVILERVPEAKRKPSRAKPPLQLSALQPVERDFAFLVDPGVSAADVVRAAQAADKLITAVTVFDVYQGAAIGPAKKSLAIAVRLQPRDHTLTDAEIDAVAQRIIGEVGKRTGALLRQ